MLFGIPPGHGELVVLVQQQPLLLAGAVLAPPYQEEATPQLLAVQLEVQLAGLHRGHRVVVAHEGPRTPIPHDDVATAVLAVTDHALEVGVLDRMVLDVHRESAGGRVEGRALRHGPARQHTVHLQAEVVVQPPGAVALHDERARAAGRHRGAGRLTSRLRRAREVAHRPIGVETPGVLRARHGGYQLIPTAAHRRRSRAPSHRRRSGG